MGAPQRRAPVLPLALAAGAAILVVAWCSGFGGGPSGPQTSTGPLLQTLAQESQLRPARPARSLVGDPQGQPQWGPRAGPRLDTRGGKYVITSVMGLDPERLNVFVASLRRHSPHTKLVVFVEEKTDSKLLEDYGAEVIKFHLPQGVALVLNRFDMYRKYLAQLIARDPEAGVILTDSRDVLIQSDPWEHPLVQRMIDEDAVLFSLEGGLAVGDVPIWAQPQNAHWIDTCFGANTTEALRDAPISCAGITLGSASAIHAYCAQLLEEAYTPGREKCRYYGSDQAAHNYMLHWLGPQGRLKYNFHVARNWDSPVHTAGYGWPITIDPQGVYRRVNGSFVPPIVHQYDRAFNATKIYLAMYPLPREDVYRWDGPECVKNLWLDTVNQCPNDTAKAAPAAAAAATAKQEGGKTEGGDGSSGAKPAAAGTTAGTAKGSSDADDER